MKKQYLQILAICFMANRWRVWFKWGRNKDYFQISSIMLLPNDTFVTVLLSFQELPTRDIELKDMVITFLQSVKEVMVVLSIAKRKIQYYKKNLMGYINRIVQFRNGTKKCLTYII